MARKTRTREHDCNGCGDECDCGAATAKECELCDKCYNDKVEPDEEDSWLG